MSAEPMHDNGKGPAQAEAHLRGLRESQWRWAEEVVASTPPEPAWVWRGYLAPGAKTIAAGLPKAGKSTLAAAIILAITNEAPSFLGRDVAHGPVVLLSEEGDGTLADKLRDLPPGRVRVLSRDRCWPKPPWEELIAEATREAMAIGAVLIVIDSWAFWAAFAPERENDAGATQQVMAALDEACREDLAVLLVHHQRKRGGEFGTGVRGSGAGLGAADALIELEYMGDDAPGNQRRLVAVSRWAGATPDVLVVDHNPRNGTWRVVGEATDRASAEHVGVAEKLLDAMPGEAPGATEEELVELLEADRRKLHAPLKKLLDQGLVERNGEGKKGNPYRYRRNAAPNTAPAPGHNAMRNAALPLRGAASHCVSHKDAALGEGQKGGGA